MKNGAWHTHTHTFCPSARLTKSAPCEQLLTARNAWIAKSTVRFDGLAGAANQLNTLPIAKGPAVAAKCTCVRHPPPLASLLVPTKDEESPFQVPKCSKHFHAILEPRQEPGSDVLLGCRVAEGSAPVTPILQDGAGFPCPQGNVATACCTCSSSFFMRISSKEVMVESESFRVIAASLGPARSQV